MRHDATNIFNGGDSITLVLDTFYDRRNGVLFQTNPLGALRRGAYADGFTSKVGTRCSTCDRPGSTAGGRPRW
jgi:hypothetical protein